MATTRMFVDQQLLLTIFLVALLWSLHARLRKHDFFRWWAWAWTSFAGYLGIGALALRLAPEWSLLKGSVILASLVCGFLQVPLLVFGACTLRGPRKSRRVWLRAGIAVALATSALIFAAALYCREKALASFALRTVPRTLALAAGLLFCARLFIEQWRKNGSRAAAIAAAFCSLYALDQGFYSLIYLNQLAPGLAALFPLLSSRLLLSSLPFFLDLIFEFGICLGMVLLLVEEHERTELALLKSEVRAEAMAESNVALQAEVREREQAKEALRESEDRYRDLVENSEDLLCTHDLAGKLLSCNPAPARILGYEVAELLGIPMRDLIAPEYREPFDAYLAKIKRNGADRGLIAVVTRTGERRIWDYNNTLRTQGVSSPIVRGMAHDVTERMRVESELRRSEARLAEGQRMSHTGSWSFNVSTEEVVWSQEIFRIFGLDPVKTKPTRERFFQSLHPDDQLLMEAAETKLREGQDIEYEYRILRPDGSMRFINAQSHPVVNESGKIVEFVGVLMDITGRKLAEQALQESRVELARVSRIATMGELTASIAHEINQPLAAVATNASAALHWLAAQPPNLDEAREAGRRAILEVNRASGVIERIRALLQKAQPQLWPLDGNEVIREVLLLAEAELLRGGVTARTELAADVPRMLGDRVQVQQVILNLVRNAIDAMSTITDRQRELLIRSAKHPDGVLIQVQDSGKGLDPQHTARIFEPFFTTKPEGIGMGLSISRSIVEAHGGRLWATSGSPHGAVFQLILPAAESGA